MKKQILSAVLISTMLAATLAGCGSKAADPTTAAPAAQTEAAKGEETKAPETDAKAEEPKVDDANLSEVEKIIKEAESMSMEELAKKAIEESNGKTFYGVGNSSRGKTALPLFIEYLQSIDPSYTMEYEWQQPKNNKIFEQLSADSLKSSGTFAMTLIQDGNQIESKMVQTGILKTFIPKEWADANGTTADAYTGFLPLQTLNKVFMYNSTGNAEFNNCWDFVAEGVHPLYMDIDSEVVGKNFLYMLTEDKYAGWLKEAYDALDSSKQAYFKPVVDEMATDAEDLGLGENGAYALAWIKLWVENYNEQTDDGPICNTLVSKTATDQCGLLVYSKLRSVEESSEVSVNNIKVAAYQDGYKGKDMGGYSSNPKVMEETEKIYGHSKGGYNDKGENEFDSKNDRGYEWWTTDGELVLEDPEYCADVSFTVGSWIELLTKYSDSAQ